MKMVRIFLTWNETLGQGLSEPRFVAGQTYPLTEDTQRQVDIGNGELVDMLDEAAAPAAP